MPDYKHFILFLFVLATYSNCYSTTYENLSDTSKVIDLLNLAAEADGDSVLYYLNEAEQVSKQNGFDSLFYEVKMDKAQYWYDIDSISRSEAEYRSTISSLDRKNKRILAKAYQDLAAHYIFRSIFVKAKNALDSALYLVQSDSLSMLKANIVANLGILYDKQGLYTRALDQYMQALEYYKKLGNKEAISSQLNGIAIIYKRQEDLESAEKFYQQAYDMAESAGDSSGMAVCGVNLGLLYKDLNRFEDSENMFTKSLDYFQRTKFKYGIAVVLHNFGELKRKQKLYNEATDLYIKSNGIARPVDIKVLIAKNNLSLAHIAYAKENYTLSTDYALKSLEVAEQSSMPNEMKEVHQLLSDCYEAQLNYKKALQHYKAYSELADSLLSENNHQHINKLKAQYELSQKELEIETLKHEKELQEAEVAAEEKEKKLYIFLIIFLIVFIAFGAFGYFRTRSLNKELSEQKLHIAEQKEEIETQHSALEERNIQLQELNKEKDEIIAIVAHDLRSPLNRIIGLLDLLKKDFQPQFSDMAMQSAEDLRSRINHILDVEALNAREVKLYPKKISAKEIVNEVYANFESTASHKDIQLKKAIPKGDPMVKVDIDIMKEVCENLVSNAIKFSPANSTVWIKVNQTNSKVRFQFKDEGPGMSEQDHQNLFTKFKKLSARPTGDEQSSGLGLAIVKKYVDALGGKVWCESEKSKGAEFIVELPEAKAKHVTAQKSKRAISSS